MIGVLYIIISFLIVLGLLLWGIKYTRKHINQERAIKYRAAAFLVTIGVILSVGYILGAKKFSENIDIVINWMILSTGLLFASTVCFFIAYMHDKLK